MSLENRVLRQGGVPLYLKSKTFLRARDQKNKTKIFLVSHKKKVLGKMGVRVHPELSRY
jgi:hypothetical protein